MMQVFALGGRQVKPAMEANLIKLLSESQGDEAVDRELRCLAVRQLYELVVDPLAPANVLRVAVWIFGEYGHLSTDPTLGQIVELLGGHVAEKIALGDVSTGATSDLSRANDLARRMITEYGMNDEIGPLYLGGDQEVFVGRDFGHTRNYSEELAAKVDEQLVRYLNDALATATNLLNQNRDKLDRVAQELMNREKLDKDEFVTIMEGGSLSPLDGMPSANPIEDLLKA